MSILLLDKKGGNSMIINKSTKAFQTRSDKPNENWLNEDWVCVSDNGEFAKIIKENYPNIDIEIEGNKVISVTPNKVKEIIDLKQKLADTDYQAIKYAEGQISEKDYQPIKEQRQVWRDRINELESEVESNG